MPFGKELSHLIEEQISKTVESKNMSTNSTGIASRSGVDEGRIAALEANLQRLAEKFTNFLGSQKKNKRNAVDYGLKVIALHGLRLAVTAGRAIFVDQDEPLDMPYTYLQLANAASTRQLRYIYLDSTGVVLESTTDPTNIGTGYLPLAMVDIWSGVAEITQDKIKDLRPRLGAEESNNADTYQQLNGNTTLYSPDTGNDSFIVVATNPAGLKVNVTSGRALVAGEILNAEGGLLDLTNHRNVVKEFIAFSDGVTKTFHLYHKSISNVIVYVDDIATSTTVDAANGSVTFAAAPGQGAKVEVSYTFSGNYMLVFLVEKAQTNDGTSFGVVSWKVGSNRNASQPPELASYQHAIAKVDMSGSITAITGAIIDNSYEVKNLTQYDLQYGGNLDSSSLKTGAITGDKIAANSITGEKIVAGTITGDRITAGSINTANLKAGAVTSDRIAAGAITTNHLATGSITADKIKATDLKIVTNLSDHTTAGLAINADGLKLVEDSGAYTLFDKKGISWYSNAGIPFGSVRRMVAGTVQNGKFVRLNWEKQPVILLAPRTMQTTLGAYDQSDIQVVCEPYEVSPAGFRVRLETRLISGAATTPVNLTVSNSCIFTTIDFCTDIYLNMIAYCDSYHTGGSNGSDHDGVVTGRFYYRAQGATNWIYVGDKSSKGAGSYTYSYTIATGLPSGKYDVKIILYYKAGPGSYLKVSSYSSNGKGGVIASNGQVAFLAMEVDGTDSYTIE